MRPTACSPRAAARRRRGLAASVRRSAWAWTLLAALVLAPGCSRTIGLPVEDMTLAFAVRTALVNDTEVGAAPVEVVARDGVITLDGRVATSGERDRIVDLARAVGGVRRVESRITLGAPSTAEPADPPTDAARQRSALPPADPWPPSRHFAIGGAVERSYTQSGALDGRWSIGPAFRFGRGSGLGPTFSIAWLRSDLPPTSDTDSFGSLRQALVAGGVAYTWTDERWSLSTALAGGFSFNHIRLEPGAVVPPDASLPVAVDGSFALAPSISLWREVSPRVSVGLTTGYVLTRPNASWLEGDRFARRRLNADAFVVAVGAAYWVF